MIPTKSRAVSQFLKISSVVFCMLSGFISHADIPLQNGILDINVSGQSGSGHGQDGDDAGQIDLVLSYSDTAKTMIKISGTAKSYGRTSTISQVVAVTDLKLITLEAVGGDGSAGYDGTSGSDGYDGRNGWDGASGCPPQPGTNGTNGTDGYQGGNAGNGGNGGNGGNIHVRAAADQTELLLLVKMQNTGGLAGAGGRGGSGGRGGRGGSGGSGGRNTCDPVGADAQSGYPGQDGYTGQDGRSGYNGYEGRGGVTGYDVGTSSSVESYDQPFNLSVSATIGEDIEDGVFEPGEKLYVTKLVITNTGSMPTPLGQTIHLALSDSTTLQVISGSALTFNQVIPAGGKQTLTFNRGDLVFQVPDKSALVGRNIAIATTVLINHIEVPGVPFDTGHAVRWPLIATASLSNVNGLFESVTPITYVLKNISKKDIGLNGAQSFAIDLSWASNNIPDSAVTVILANGTRYQLDRPAEIRDLTVPANSSITLNFQLAVLDSQSTKTGNGVFNFNLKLKSLVTGHEQVVQTAATTMNMTLDLFNLAFDQTIDLKNKGMTCVFKNRANAVLPVTGMHIVKVKMGTTVKIQMFIKGATAVEQSPDFSMPSHLFFPYLANFEAANTSPITLDLLNKTLAVQSVRKGTWAFSGCK